MQSRDERFAQHIRDYFSERLGISFHTRDYGFVGYKIDGTDLYIDEWYVEPRTTFFKALRIVKEVVEIGKQHGCTRLIGCNETTLPTYKDIRTLHVWFGMEHIGDNGTLELWAREI